MLMLEGLQSGPTLVTSPLSTDEDFDGILTLFKSDNDILDHIMKKEESING